MTTRCTSYLLIAAVVSALMLAPFRVAALRNCQLHGDLCRIGS